MVNLLRLDQVLIIIGVEAGAVVGGTVVLVVVGHCRIQRRSRLSLPWQQHLRLKTKYKSITNLNITSPYLNFPTITLITPRRPIASTNPTRGLFKNFQQLFSFPKSTHYNITSINSVHFDDLMPRVMSKDDLNIDIMAMPVTKKIEWIKMIRGCDHFFPPSPASSFSPLPLSFSPSSFFYLSTLVSSPNRPLTPSSSNRFFVAFTA